MFGKFSKTFYITQWQVSFYFYQTQARLKKSILESTLPIAASSFEILKIPSIEIDRDSNSDSRPLHPPPPIWTNGIGTQIAGPEGSFIVHWPQAFATMFSVVHRLIKFDTWEPFTIKFYDTQNGVSSYQFTVLRIFINTLELVLMKV